MMKEVDLIIGNNQKIQEETWKNFKLVKKQKFENIMDVKKIYPNVVEKFDGNARAYVEIQQGCNHRCTFCVIPFGRGNNRSVPIGLITKRVKKLVSNGYKEVVLTGVDITDYGNDLPGKPNLSQMIKNTFNNWYYCRVIPINYYSKNISNSTWRTFWRFLWSFCCSCPNFYPNNAIYHHTGTLITNALPSLGNDLSKQEGFKSKVKSPPNCLAKSFPRLNPSPEPLHESLF